MFDRIAPVYDSMNRVMTAGLDLRWRRLAASAVVRSGRPRARRRVRHRRPRARRPARGRRRGDRARLLRADARARAAQVARRSSGCEGDLLALPFADGTFDAATIGFGVRNLADLELGLRELHRVLRPGGRLAILEITPSARRAAAVLLALVRPPRPARREGCCRAARRTRTSRRRCGASPPRRSSSACSVRRGFTDVRFRLLAGSIVALHTGDRAT